MRTRLDELVGAALERGAAVPAFTCYDFTTALAMVAAAEESGRGVILLVAPKTAGTVNGLRLIAALRGLADSASVPVSVQLDHASDLGLIRDSIAAGADAVLADGSSLPFEENIALVQEVRAVLASSGGKGFGAGVGSGVGFGVGSGVVPEIVIEAELGGLAGDEDRAFGVPVAGQSLGLTDPSQVEEFASRSGAQLLAVAVGNAHGRYSGEPKLHWDVLESIAARTEVPLVLHGASGIPAADLVKATSLRVGKVNFNTELRTGILATLEAETATHRADGENLQGLLGCWNASASGFAAATLDMLSG